MIDFKNNYDAIRQQSFISQKNPWVNIGSIVPATGTLGTNGTMTGTTENLDGASELMIFLKGTQAAGGAPGLFAAWYQVPDGVTALHTYQGTFSVADPQTDGSIAGFSGPTFNITNFGKRVSFRVINPTATSVIGGLVLSAYAR